MSVIVGVAIAVGVTLASVFLRMWLTSLFKGKRYRPWRKADGSAGWYGGDAGHHHSHHGHTDHGSDGGGHGDGGGGGDGGGH